MDNKIFLFPLKNALLFKKVTLPFHVYEDRYRQMVKDSMAMQIPVAVVQAESRNNYYGDICVGGLAHILTNYPDGQMDIYITGSVKCMLTQLEEEGPYKVYSYRTIEEDLRVDDSCSLELDCLRTLLERWAIHFLPNPVQRETFGRTLEDPEILINYCAVFLVDDVNIKRTVMEANTLIQKVRILLQVIGPKEVSLGPFMPTLKF